MFNKLLCFLGAHKFTWVLLKKETRDERDIWFYRATCKRCGYSDIFEGYND